MGFLEEIAENTRRDLTGDDWYYKAEPYVLELQTIDNPAKTGILGGRAFMVLALGPENYTVERIFRQSVTPTLGGLVAEERGLLWRMLTIEGTFGLQPKFAFDSSMYASDPTRISPSGGTLSGPGWTRRMIRNYFEKYAALKADPETSAATRMIWHDVKTDDHWVVVPETVSVARTVARRFQYPYTIRLKAIADADGTVPERPAASLTGLGKVAKATAQIKQALAQIDAVLTETSAVLGEVRFFVSTIDTIVDDLNTIVSSATDFVNGVTDTILVGRTFVTSTTALLQSALDLMEATAELPVEVRQTYAMAADALDTMAAQIVVFGRTYGQEGAEIGAVEGGANAEARTSLQAQQDAGPPATVQELSTRRGRTNDVDLVDAQALPNGRTFAAYSGFREHAIQATDSLPSLAAKFLGDGALWYDIAIVNGLKPPYITPSGAPGTVSVGDIISIPTTTSTPENGVVAGGGSEPGTDLLGTDLALEETANSLPGRPSVDLAIDKRTYRDAKLISGVGNLSQALQLRTWTERGTMPLLPRYGLPRTIGIGATGAFLAMFRVNFRETLSADPRVAAITGTRFVVDGDLLEIDTDIIPVGAETARTISTAIV